MKDHITQSNLMWLLLRANMLTKFGILKLSESYNLTPPQMFTLCSLQPDRAVPMHSIGTILHCDASNVTGIVDRLVLSGLIERKESEYDRRVKAVRLTAKGIQLYHEVLEQVDQLRLAEQDRLTAAEQKTLKRLLLKLVEPDAL